MGEVLVRAFGCTVAARYLDNSEEMVRERYPHIEAGELGDVATEALNETDGELVEAGRETQGFTSPRSRTIVAFATGSRQLLWVKVPALRCGDRRCGAHRQREANGAPRTTGYTDPGRSRPEQRPTAERLGFSRRPGCGYK